VFRTDEGVPMAASPKVEEGGRSSKEAGQLIEGWTKEEGLLISLLVCSTKFSTEKERDEGLFNGDWSAVRGIGREE
jgi:hypothetical protein